MQSIRKQAFLLTAANGFTRMLGFGLRLIMARMMGAEALGIMEMAHSVEMLALTPVTAGTPTAMSRLIATRQADEHPAVLRAGINAIFKLSAILMPLMLLCSPAIAALLGDFRTLPVLLMNVPCILLLGLGSVYNGYCYGQQQMWLPALNECVEQLVRCIGTISLLILLRNASTGIIAAIPCTAECFAALIVFLIFAIRIPFTHVGTLETKQLIKQFRSLASPIVAGRMCTAGLRTCNAFLIPLCLQVSGLSQSAATSQYGMMTGMVMPVLMLPGIVTGALCMATVPAVSARENSPEQLDSLLIRVRRLSFLIGLAAAAFVVACSEYIGMLFRVAEVATLLRIMSPLALLMALQQVQHGIIQGLGLQRRQLTGSLIGSVLSTLIIALLAIMPRMRLYGVAIGMIAGQIFTYFWGCALIRRYNDKPHNTAVL